MREGNVNKTTKSITVNVFSDQSAGKFAERIAVKSKVLRQATINLAKPTAINNCSTGINYTYTRINVRPVIKYKCRT